jgi:hypothetical protein
MEKVKVKLLGQDGNIFNLVGICTKALRRAGQADIAEKLKDEVFASGSYDKALVTIMKYVEVK